MAFQRHRVRFPSADVRATAIVAMATAQQPSRRRRDELVCSRELSPLSVAGFVALADECYDR